MKKLKALVAICLSLTAGAFADEFKDKALQIDSLYRTGLIAANQGKEAEAKAAFEEVLKLQPGHGHARHQLKQLPATIAKVRMARREAHFKTTILKEINFNKATLAETVEALNLLTVEASDQKFAPNLVIQDPTGKLSDKTVTLKMTNIPLSAVLRYVTDLTGTTVRYDQHMTVIRPVTK